jgi:uncharacterized protein DUF5995
MFAYDARLLAAVQSAPQSIADVLGTMRTIDATCIDGDGLKWFNRLYLQVTEAVAAQVVAGFVDPAWLAELDVQFARLYFGALRCGLSGEPAPHCWNVLLSCRAQPMVARIQFALVGVNAHINHDLPEAIVAACQATGTAPARGGAQYRDYTAVNSTLDSLIEAAKRTLNVRLLGDALPPVSHMEDTIAAWNVCAARESAWLNAEHLWRIRSLPILASSFKDMLDGMTTVIGKTLLVPVV